MPATGSSRAASSKPARSVEQALRRELHEELGIRIAAALPWQVELVSYEHARVRLHFCKVFDWRVSSRCGRASRWPGKACR